jgi:cytochrome c oxidase subunit 2
MTTLLIFAVIVLAFLVVMRLHRVSDLAAALRGEREELIPEKDNRTSGRLMWVIGAIYLVFFTWVPIHFKSVFLPPPASTQGVWIDAMYHFNWIMLGIVFYATNIALFYFSGKYFHRPGKKAFWYPHNNRLELLWTAIPAMVLIVVIIYGLSVWNKITAAPAPGTMAVEVYAKQFDWTIRYPGKDKQLGATDFRLINGDNPLGIVTGNSVKTRLAELQADLEKAEADLIAQSEIRSDGRKDDMEDHISHIRRQREGIMNLETLMKEDIAANGNNSTYLHGADDQVTKEFHLPQNVDVELLIRSQDVIHSAYLPHMRAQMNAVPGMVTRIHLVPTITTDSMREVTNNPEFDYILLCNKVCGISHYNMQMPLTVEKPGAFKVWTILLPTFENRAKADEPAPADTVKTQVAAEAKADSTTTEMKQH